MDSPSRRRLLHAGVAAVAGGAAPRLATAADPVPAGFDLDPVPAIPARPTPGRPGDFDFLAGEWRIEHLRRGAGGRGWDRFAGEATCWSILGGVGSVEELRIPVRGFGGMGLRLLDVEKRLWADHWVNAKVGVVSTPGQPGSFEGGVGIFHGEDEEGAAEPMRSVGVWDRITPSSCRWWQAFSRDGGATWTHDWVMHWQRVAARPRA